MDSRQDQFGFGQVAEQEFYREVNRKLVESVDLSLANRVVDLACGSGMITEEIAKRLKKTHDQMVIGIDQSKEALSEARNKVQSTSNDFVKFVQSKMEYLSDVLSDSPDAVFLGNAIHYIGAKKELIRTLYSSLSPGGAFAFNTSFFEGGQPEEANRFYRRWMMQALRILRKEHDLKPDSDQKVESRKHLSAEEYEEILRDSDFDQVESELIPTEMPLEGWEAISEYKDFIEGSLPGIPLELGSEVLKTSVRQTYEKLDLDTVPRNWLQIIAKKSKN